MENTPKKRLWIVTELFYPDETATAFILTEIAKALSENREINVICGKGLYQSNYLKAADGLNEKITIYRIGFSFRLNKNVVFQRVIKHFILSFQLIWQLLKRSRKNEEILTVTNPAPMLLLIPLVSWLKKSKISIIVHDVFPENILPIGILKENSWKYKTLSYFFNKAYQSADNLIVLGRDMQKVVKEKTKNSKTPPTISIIHNWADVTEIKPKSKNLVECLNGTPFYDKIIFQFAGNIGRVQGLEELMKVINSITNPNLHFVFRGEGAMLKELIDYVNIHEIKNVTFGKSFSREEQNEYLNACDVGIVSLYDSMLGLGVPSKTYNLMSAGKPILYIGSRDSEIGMMINEYDIGWQFECVDFDSLKSFLENFSIEKIKGKGLNSRLLAQTKYSKEEILFEYSKLFQT